MDMADHQEHITDTLIELADTLVSDYDLVEYLDRLLERSTAVLAADAGGVMLSRGRNDPGDLELLTCTSEHIRELELFELEHQQGPCVDSHRRGEAVVVSDLEGCGRWPAFSAAALERGYRGVYAFPMRLRGSAIGVLNMYRQQPGRVAVRDVGLAQAFADMATIGILQHRAVDEARQLAAQLQSALHSRVVIEQAKGVLAERVGCALDEAYQLMRWHARDHNIRLRAVAAAVVAGTLRAEELTTP